MIKAIALDDELPALDVIEAFCSQIDAIDLRKTFTRTGEARYYLEENPVDLLFLDINMPAESGISFYKSMSPLLRSQQTMVIFTTAYSEFAVESYDLQAVDYLLKPFTFSRFLQAVHKASEQHKFLHQSDPSQQPRNGEPAASAYLFFRVDYGLMKVAVADILFIEGLDNYLKIHLAGQKPLVVRLTMKAMLEKLPPTRFVRVHRSYIVSLDKVQTVRNKLITIDEEEIPIGNSYEEGFFRLFRV